MLQIILNSGFVAHFGSQFIDLVPALQRTVCIRELFERVQLIYFIQTLYKGFEPIGSSKICILVITKSNGKQTVMTKCQTFRML
ncbi:hypothetical protein D3C73_1408370 [compost metagenome]